MKKVILIVVGSLLVVLAALISIPFLFKDKIRQVVDRSLEQSLKAKVYYDPARFGLSVLRTFPNPTVSLGDFGIVGLPPFERDTLLSIGEFDITLNLFSLWRDPIVVKSINLVDPVIALKILEDGAANYDIVPEATEADSALEAQQSELKIRVDRWKISGGRFVYDDRGLDIYMELNGIRHSGSGNFTLDVFDLKTSTVAESVIYRYEGIPWLNGQKVDADITLLVDLNSWSFTFKENLIRLNDLPIAFDGFFQMPEEGYYMDLKFAAVDATVKSLYSLIPAVYTEEFGNIRTEGTLQLEGHIKGMYSDTSTPAYRLALNADRGFIQYPGLSTPISDIRLNMLLESITGEYDDIHIDIPSFHLKLGSNPIDGKLQIRNLRNYDMQAALNAKLNLADMMAIFPMEGMDLRGNFMIELDAEGIYDSAAGQFPRFQAAMSMAQGYLKSSSFPKVIEDITFSGKASCTTGRMRDAAFEVTDGRLVVDREPFELNLQIRDLDDYQWDLGVAGVLDLELVRQFYPVEGLDYSGRLQADIRTSGRYSDAMAGRYDRLPTSGQIGLTDFVYRSQDLPAEVRIASARAEFTPEVIVLHELSGRAGKSDFNISGQLSNYVRYFFHDNETLEGRISMSSQLLDLNEWMSGEPTEADTQGVIPPTDSLARETIAIPKVLDIEMAAKTSRVYYDNLVLTNGQGNVLIRDGVLDLRDFSFNLYNGLITMSGTYDTREPQKPLFNYRLNVNSLSIPAAFIGFTAVQALAPIAGQMNGDFSAEFNLGGQLDSHMNLVPTSLNGGGLIRISEAAIRESVLVNGLMSFASPGSAPTGFQLKDLLLSASLVNGRAAVQPFDLKLGKYKATLSGTAGVDGSIDYLVVTDIEASQAGEQVSRLLASLQGGSDAKTYLNFRVGGDYRSPQFSPILVDAQGNAITVEGIARTQAGAIGGKLQEKLGSEAARLLGQTADTSAITADTVATGSTPAVPPDVKDQVEKATEDVKKTWRNLLDRKKN